MSEITNERVAELKGWYKQHPEREDNWFWVNKDTCLVELPDWIHDLQLVHDDLESVLTDDEWFEYLKEIVSHEINMWDSRLFTVCNADAATKCAAWCQVMENRKDR